MRSPGSRSSSASSSPRLLPVWWGLYGVGVDTAAILCVAAGDNPQRVRSEDLESQAAFRGRWLAEHPDLACRLEHVQRELQRLDNPIRAELLDRLDAMSRAPGDRGHPSPRARRHPQVP
jgi:hypothetical protein